MTRISILFVVLMTCLLASCSSDEDKYISEFPIFEDITFYHPDSKESSLKVGEPFVATAIQKQKGKLLNTTKYRWNLENASNATHKYKSSVVYDINSENPEDTIVIDAPGRYTLIFSAEYNISGQPNLHNYNVSLPNGTGNVAYKSSALKYVVTIRKKLIVP